MTGLVLLAAGASTRLGEPKQQLPYQGQTLLQRAVRAAVESVCVPVVVVVGANAPSLLPYLSDSQVHTVQNQHWEEGMASSVRCGLEYLLRKAPTLSACVFMVCDQPYTTATVLDALVQAQQEGKIVASAYSGVLGTPVLFHKRFFRVLLALQGQQGARKIVQQYQQEVIAIPFAKGAVDIDTAADYTALLAPEV
ncbi:nucleotidyltransferase family protein [Pontibacter actiniarum]|uniref:MobA-like protein n=1 Tax=Pontibacter actiniarum TaxID=323450 RepID=A0A1X9YSI3_9BACT|nr:nucleotidyltransferase family protein [Pontibacter actiniarum]ARS35835.1 MobA-like protein [Pontibacter actiniarum]